MPAQIAVGDDPDEATALFDDADAAEALLGHRDQRIGHRLAALDQRQPFALMHDVGNILEVRAERPAGMENLEVVRGESAGFEQRDRETVAERELHRRRRRRREPVRAGLLRARQKQHNIGLFAERRLRLRRDRDQRHGKAARIRDDRLELDGLARPRQRQDQVRARDHPEIAVRRFARMHEKCGRPGRRERGRDLLPDVAALADAGDDDASLDRNETAHRLLERSGEIAVQFACELNEPFRLEVERPHRRSDTGFEA